MHASTPIYSLLIALALPACVLDTKLIDNPVLTDSGSVVTTDDMGTTTAPTSETGSPADDACDLNLYTAFEWFVVTSHDFTWQAPIDESCTVLANDPPDYVFELRLDCPQHAAEHGEFVVALLGGPIPAAVPQPGDTLEVYYQPPVPGVEESHPELLFLHSEGELLYASALGSFVDPNDLSVATARYAPLTLSVEPGPCPLVANPAFGDTSYPAMCAQQAIAQLHVGSPDDEARVLDEHDSDEIAVDGRSYAIKTVAVRRGAECGDLDELEWFALAIALNSAP